MELSTKILKHQNTRNEFRNEIVYLIDNQKPPTTDNWHLFTTRQTMRHFLKIILYFPLANEDKIDKTGFFFKLLLILAIRKLAIKRSTFLIYTRSTKSENFYSFITNRSVRSYTLRHKMF